MINTVLPRLVPLITKADGLTGLIDIFSGMGGVADWSAKFPVSAWQRSLLLGCVLTSAAVSQSHGCALNSSGAWPPCAWWCDAQSCDQCHPNNDGTPR